MSTATSTRAPVGPRAAACRAAALDEARAAGVIVRQGTAVQALAEGDAAVRGVVTGQGEVLPADVVVAAGSGHGFKFAPSRGGIIADVVERRPHRWAARFRWREGAGGKGRRK
jgi:glycine/D-amino acid oxidase-like deaminating enzyme